MTMATDVPFTAPTIGEMVDPATALPLDEAELHAAAVLSIYETRGWVREDKNGRNVPDEAKAKAAVYEYFRDNAVVNHEPDIVDDGLSQSDLYAKIFPGAIGATKEPVDEIQFEAYKVVLRKLWNNAVPSYKGLCQEMAEMEGLDYVMVEKKVFRTARDGNTGTGAPMQVLVRFFTSDADLIFTLSSQPAAAKLVRAAEETSKHLQMNTARHPELTARIAKETSSALKRSAAHLAPVTAGKPLAALPAANGDDE
jgi:hypothetical protein